MADDDPILPKGYTFVWRSGIVVSTMDNLSSMASEISDAMSAYGVAAAMAQSGGGTIVPFPGHLTASIRVQTPHRESEIKSRLEREVSSRFTFLGAITDLWQKSNEAATYTVNETAKDLKQDVHDASVAGGFGIGLGTTLILAGVGIVLALKYGPR